MSKIEIRSWFGYCFLIRQTRKSAGAPRPRKMERRKIISPQQHGGSPEPRRQRTSRCSICCMWRLQEDDMYAQVCLPFLQCNLPLPLFFVALKLGEVCLKSLVVVEQGTFKRMHRVKGSRQETPQYGKASRRQQKKKKKKLQENPGAVVQREEWPTKNQDTWAFSGILRNLWKGKYTSWAPKSFRLRLLLFGIRGKKKLKNTRDLGKLMH